MLDEEESVNKVTGTTLASYKKIAQNPLQRSGLLKDEASMSFLVYVLDDENVDIVQTSVEILLLLSEKSSHCSVVRNICGILPALNKIRDKNVSKELECGVDVLCARISAPEAKPLQDLQNSREKLQNSVNRCKGNGRSIEIGFKKPGMKFISGGLAQRSKSITFQMSSGLTQETESQIESELLRIKGILSIYFDFAKHRCIVRTKLEIKPEVVGRIILEVAGSSVEQVIKGDDGEELLIPVGTEEDIDLDKENQVDAPDYLNESFGDSPQKGLDDSRALARTGTTHKSKDSSNGFWGNVTSFLTNSFYW